MTSGPGPPATRAVAAPSAEVQVGAVEGRDVVGAGAGVDPRVALARADHVVTGTGEHDGRLGEGAGLGVGLGARAAGEADGQVAGVAATVEHDGRDRVVLVGEGLGEAEAADLDGRLVRSPWSSVNSGTCRIAQVSALFVGVPGGVAARSGAAELAGEDVEDAAVWCRPAWAAAVCSRA